MLKDDILEDYLKVAPSALALERSLEHGLLKKQQIAKPVLDIGCGDGVFAYVAFSEQLNTGIDYDPEEINRAVKYGKYEKLITCSGDSIPEADGSYRSIISNSVLEHIPDIKSVLIEANRLLESDGRFYITIPTDKLEKFNTVSRVLEFFGLSSLLERYCAFHNKFWKHYHAYPEHEWRTLLESAGFEVVEEVTYINKRTVLLYDVLTPLAVPAMFAKKFIGSWIAFPKLRALYVGGITKILKGLLQFCKPYEGEGCLVFYVLKKK